MDFEPLKRSYRNWRRQWGRVLRPRPHNLPEPFHRAPDIQALHEFFSKQQERIPDSTRRLRGECYVCNTTVDFRVAPPGPDGTVNWRETLSCPICGLINRWRSCIHLFEALCGPTDLDRIYLTETLSPVYRELESRYPLLIGSEYVPDAEPGEILELHARQVRNEDVTRLSFEDRCLEAVLCFDVLEHVPDYRQALREFFRVLAPGGQLVVSVPFSFQQQTIVRAVVDGTGHIEHLLPPCYHGDPLATEGVLSYYDFGMDLLLEMKRAGFAESFLVCYRSDRWGYLNNNVAFVARKLRG
jgi:SAM-dependent methyltransferase